MPPSDRSRTDALAILTTAELQKRFRDSPTLPIERLLNTGSVRLDVGRRHVYRDSFWKGSFARDTALGRIEFPWGARPFAQGSFWKRFDRIENGVCRGHVVNYELHSVPGDPEVRALSYPKADRAYFTPGAPFLLLNYRNDPYRIVYDTIKVIGPDQAIGVMHLGTFPEGLEFATFFMERHNYPFLKMSAADFRMLAALPGVEPVRPAAAGGEWEGTLLSLADPDRVLLSKVNPLRLRVTADGADSLIRFRYRVGWGEGADLVAGSGSLAVSEEFDESAGQASFSGSAVFLPRSAGHPDAMAGRWVTSDGRLLGFPGMHQYAEPAGDRFGFYFFLERRPGD